MESGLRHSKISHGPTYLVTHSRRSKLIVVNRPKAAYCFGSLRPFPERFKAIATTGKTSVTDILGTMTCRNNIMDSMCFGTRSSWPPRNLKLPGLSEESLRILPDRLPSLSEYVQDDFPSPQLKEDFDGNLIVQLDNDYPRSSAQDVVPRSCFDVLNNQGRPEAALSLISTSLAPAVGFQPSWTQSGCVPATSADNFPASLGTSVCQNLPLGRNSPFAPSAAATIRELSSAHCMPIHNPSFQTTALPFQNNFQVSSMGGLPISHADCFSEKLSSGAGYGRQEMLPYSWSGSQPQQYPGPTSTDKKLTALKPAPSPSDLSNDYSSGSLDSSVTCPTGSLVSPPLRKRTSESALNLEDAEARKLELKRAKNREAAQRCQQRKQERVVRLEGKVGKLKEQNVALTQTVRGLREQIAWLQRQVVTHANNGCQLSVPRF